MRSLYRTVFHSESIRAAMLVAAFMALLLGADRAAAEGSFGIAALPPQRAGLSATPGALAPERPRVEIPRSRSEALELMQRVASRLGRGTAMGQRDQLMAELEAAIHYARGVDRGGLGPESFQWHRAGSVPLSAEQGRAVVRPLKGLRFVSAVAVETPGGGVQIDRIRVISASGVAFEFGADRAARENRGERSVFLLDRELELVGVEVLYRRAPGGAESRIDVAGGICVKPRHAAECAYRLNLARQSVADGRYRFAVDRLRESIALLATAR